MRGLLLGEPQLSCHTVAPPKPRQPLASAQNFPQSFRGLTCLVELDRGAPMAGFPTSLIAVDAPRSRPIMANVRAVVCGVRR